LFIYSRKLCIWCKRLTYSINNKLTKHTKGLSTKPFFSPNKKKILPKIKSIKKNMQQRCYRARKTILRLQIQLNKIKDEINSFSEKILDELLENSEILKGQCELIKEIFLAAKVKNSKNRCYSENWTLLCLLFQIR